MWNEKKNHSTLAVRTGALCAGRLVCASQRCRCRRSACGSPATAMGTRGGGAGPAGRSPPIRAPQPPGRHRGGVARVLHAAPLPAPPPPPPQRVEPSSGRWEGIVRRRTSFVLSSSFSLAVSLSLYPRRVTKAADRVVSTGGEGCCSTDRRRKNKKPKVIIIAKT